MRHDNSSFTTSWFLDRIDITDRETDRTYPFICERWLSKKKEDGKIHRTLYVKGYEVTVETLKHSLTSSLIGETSGGDVSMCFIPLSPTYPLHHIPGFHIPDMRHTFFEGYTPVGSSQVVQIVGATFLVCTHSTYKHWLTVFLLPG